MLTISPTFGLAIKLIGLTAIAAILFTGSLSIGGQTSYAQFGAPQEQEEQGAGEQQVESDGGLTATLNGDSFTRGDTIIIGGTVAEREGGSTVYARTYDPDSIEIDFKSIRVNTDGSFRQGFVAGEDSLNDGTSDPMTKSGTYTIALEYSPPDNADIETTELTFEYDAEAPPAVASQDDSATAAGGDGQTTTFQNLTEGFRIQVPDGWVADDADVSDFAREEFRATYGYEYLGAICAQDDALPKIGGLYECPDVAADAVSIVAYPNLHTRPEFARIINQNQNITLNDLLAFDIEGLRSRITNQEIASRVSIEGQTDTSVNVVDPTTNQTVQTLPAVEVVYGIPATFGDAIFVTYALLVLADNGNTGYSVQNLSEEGIELDDEMPTFVRQAFDSFELLTPSSRPNVTSSLSPQEQSGQQLVQSAGGLTARLNANNFTTGDTITVNGTVAERGALTSATIYVIDPQGQYLGVLYGTISADNFFTASFLAGVEEPFGLYAPMAISGNYLMRVEYGTDTVEFIFRYDAAANVTGASPSTAPVSSPSSNTTMAGNNTGNTEGPLSGITDSLQNLFGGGNQTTSGGASGAEMNMTTTTGGGTTGGGTTGGGATNTTTTGGTEGGNSGADPLEGIFGGVS